MKISNGFHALNNDNAVPDSQSAEKKLRDVSAMYEKHFLAEMMKAMRSTVSESGFIKTNQAEKIFREQLDQEYTGKWGDQGGIGLQDLIYNQLIEKFGAQMGIRAMPQKPQGPIPIDSHSDFKGKPIGPKDSTDLRIRFDRNKSFGEASPQGSSPRGSGDNLLAPWDGKLVKNISLGEDENLLELDHQNGLLSQIVYRGPKSYLKENSQVNPGQSLALLSPEASGFFWNIKTNW